MTLEQIKAKAKNGLTCLLKYRISSIIESYYLGKEMFMLGVGEKTEIDVLRSSIEDQYTAYKASCAGVDAVGSAEEIATLYKSKLVRSGYYETLKGALLVDLGKEE